MSRGAGTITKRGKIWWVQVCVDGRVIRQSSKSEKYEIAKKLRDKLLGQRARGELGGRNAKLTVNLIIDHFLKALAFRVRKETLENITLVVNAHIRPYFGKTRAERISSEQLMEYRIKRQDAGAAPSTVNRELTHLRNALRTAAHDTPPLIPLACIPRFTMVSELGRARQGFLDDDGFAKLIVEMPMYLVPLVTCAYNTGIRQGELLKIQWDQVDFDAQLIRLKSGETKGGPGRSAPFIGAMEDVLVQARKERDEFWPECKYVFSRLGERIKEPKGAWGAAVIRAGMPDLLFHDLRRSGVRNLVRAGVPEAVAMKISGHKTRSVFDRYDITSGQDLADAASKVKAYRALKTSTTVPATDTKTDTVQEKGGSF